MNIRRAVAEDRAAIMTLLTAGQLPVEDLEAEPLDLFLVLEDGLSVVGTVGLERYGDIALVRSLAVASNARGQGHGQALAPAAESLAARSGISTLYLLTTSAEGFFRSRGYKTISRDECPAAIRATPQFSALCPATAVVMVRP